jgi:hypothetical protein
MNQILNINWGANDKAYLIHDWNQNFETSNLNIEL